MDGCKINFPDEIPLTPEEQEYISSSDLPLCISRHMQKVLVRLYRNFCVTGDDRDFLAIRRQLVPSPEEKKVYDNELADPLGAHLFQKTPRLIHQYKNRVLLLTTAACFSFCRHCFRRSYAARKQGWITQPEILEVCRYLAEHQEVQECLLSGGDPLTASDRQLFDLIRQLRSARPGILIRICTRAPVFQPERITPALLDAAAAWKPLWFILHINHPAEISDTMSPESLKALMCITGSGLPVQSQTVLLRGVNDTVPVLARLFHQLVCIGIRPGYLFQGDLVPGTMHLRVPVREGVRLYEQLRKELSGLSIPVYAVDLPGGGGKINLLQLDPELLETKIVKTADGYRFIRPDGSAWHYPG